MSGNSGVRRYHQRRLGAMYVRNGCDLLGYGIRIVYFSLSGSPGVTRDVSAERRLGVLHRMLDTPD